MQQLYIIFVKHFHFIAVFRNKDPFTNVNSKLLVVSGLMIMCIVLLEPNITVLTVTLVAIPQDDCDHRDSCCSTLA